MKHLHNLGILIGHAKTRKTLCGLRRPESQLVTGKEQADCPDCRAARDKEIAGFELVLKLAPDTFNADDLRKQIADLKARPYCNAEVFRS